MEHLSKIGCIFYGVSIVEIGLQTIYYRDFAYMLVPPNHSGISGVTVIAVIAGVLFAFAGTCIVLEKWPRQISLWLAGILLMIFCFCFVPYQFISGGYIHLGDWENAEKELALAGGALVVAGCFSEADKTPLTRLLAKLIPAGPIIFAITIVSFGILHFLFAKESTSFVPNWIPWHLFWIYFAGVALLGSGIAIILKIKADLAATLLGSMIFIWFISLHIPRIIAAPATDVGGELTSAIIALAYSGIAFVIAGNHKKIIGH